MGVRRDNGASDAWHSPTASDFVTHAACASHDLRHAHRYGWAFDSMSASHGKVIGATAEPTELRNRVFAGKKETAKGLFSERSRTLTDTSMPEHTGPLRRVEPDWICAGSLMSGRVDV